MSKESVKISKQDAKEIETQISILYEYMQMTQDIISGIDPIACQAIENIVSMAMVSLGRKYGLDYCASEEAKIDNAKEKEIDDIMKDINEGTKD